MKDIEYEDKVKAILKSNLTNDFLDVAKAWHDKSRDFGYQYLMSCGGRPIIQDPQDIVAISEILWDAKPDIVIETGVARGGSFMLHLMVMSFVHNFFPHLKKRNWRVIGIDLNLSDEFRLLIDKSGFSDNAILIEASSVDPVMHSSVKDLIEGCERKVIFLDSDHTHDHVLQELQIFSKYLRPSDELVVMDTGVEFMPEYQQTHSRWGKGSNPHSAVQEFLSDKSNQAKFIVDESFYKKFGVTCFRGGWLRCVN